MIEAGGQPDRPGFVVREEGESQVFVMPAETPLAADQRSALEDLGKQNRRENARWLKQFRADHGY